MGCLFSKRLKSTDSNQSVVRSSAFNIIHSFTGVPSTSSQTPVVITPITPSDPNKVITKDKVISILSSPKQDELKLHAWLRKRGHLIRSWKRRYFVLTSNSLKYYEKDIPEPPYGENLCGEVYLRGAVIEVRKNAKEKTTWVEIAGRKGEKDLTIELNKSIDNQWINAIEWTIRRCSKSYIDKVLRSNQYAPGKEQDGLEDLIDSNATSNKRLQCLDWVQNERKKYDLGLKNLCIRRQVPIHVYKFDGQLTIELCEVSIWTIISSDDDLNLTVNSSYIRGVGALGSQDIPLPTPQMSPRSYGIKYILVENQKRRGLEPEVRILSCADIININLYRTNMDGTEVATAVGDKVKTITGKAITTTISTAGRKASVSVTCRDYACSKLRNKIISIDTCYGHSLDFICCCEYDHQDLFYSLRNILLYLRLNVPNDECIKPNEEVNDRMKSLSCFQAKMKLEKI